VKEMAKARTNPRRRTKTKPIKKPSRIAGPDIFEHLIVKHIRLIDVHAHLEIHDGKLPVRAKIESGGIVSPGVDRTIHVDVIVNIEGRPQENPENSDSEGPSSVANVGAQYQCVFEINDDTPLESFIEHSDKLARVGMNMAWPYLRETVHSVTLKMAIPPFVIPTFVPTGKGEHLVSIKQEGPPKK
jgi:hypothetical protein